MSKRGALCSEKTYLLAWTIEIRAGVLAEKLRRCDGGRKVEIRTSSAEATEQR